LAAALGLAGQRAGAAAGLTGFSQLFQDLWGIGAFRALHRAPVFGYIRATFRLVPKTYRASHTPQPGLLPARFINRGEFK
jgi:hypothetical protein